jgi:hypothetical protein
MASFIYDSALYDALTGSIDFRADAFKVLLVTRDYRASKSGHSRRSDIAGEVVAVGYGPGGEAAHVTVAADRERGQINIALGAATWPDSTITARGAIYCKSRGGPASADELVAYIDFVADIASNNGPFNLAASTLRIQN